MSAHDLWNRILESLRGEVNPQIYNTWFAPLVPVTMDGDSLVLFAPHGFIRDWIEENYLSTIVHSAQSLAGRQVSVHIQVNDAQLPDAAPVAEAIPEPRPVDNGKAAPKALRPGPEATTDSFPALNPKYTFATFVVGASNQFAHAAALAVAEQPARSYNPLFIYGGVGLGKTHLMHAIGAFVLSRNPAIRLCYLSSESFMNELINCLRFDRMPLFREKYRNMDILLVDDIQFIAGKERTQEEFFHTFNSLFDSHKQIVVSSDKFPREIPDLEERLRSRFEWGLVADIQPPDLETKVAILGKKAEASGVILPPEVSLFLAENTGTNIRELEGYLQRVTAFAAFSHTKVLSVSLVQEALKNFLEQRKKAITAEQILKRVASFYAVKISDLKSKKKNKALILPRHSAMYLTRQLTDLSLPEIGRQMGGRDHTTVLHAIQKIENLVRESPEHAKVLESLIQELEGGA